MTSPHANTWYGDQYPTARSHFLSDSAETQDHDYDGKTRALRHQGVCLSTDLLSSLVCVDRSLLPLPASPSSLHDTERVYALTSQSNTGQQYPGYYVSANESVYHRQLIDYC